MTNAEAIVELRDLISDDRTDKENEALLIAIESLKNERPHGAWRSGGFCFTTMSYQCPFCKSKTLERTKFCSECGADMRGDNND